jgi:hypothetical protein
MQGRRREFDGDGYYRIDCGSRKVQGSAQDAYASGVD